MYAMVVQGFVQQAIGQTIEWLVTFSNEFSNGCTWKHDFYSFSEFCFFPTIKFLISQMKFS